MDSGWTSLKRRRPKADERKILVWHIFQGVMLTRADECRQNRFFTHWQELPTDGWERSSDRLPEKRDADVYGCVLAWDEFDGPKVTGWHQFRESGHLVRWMRIEDRREYHGGSERA